MIALVAAPVVVLAAGAVWWVASRSTPARCRTSTDGVRSVGRSGRSESSASGSHVVRHAARRLGARYGRDDRLAPGPTTAGRGDVGRPHADGACLARRRRVTALPNAPAPMARPADKRKYEPEGI